MNAPSQTSLQAAGSPNNATHQPLIGRLAPSPTGALHLGNARTFLLTWLFTRLAGGRLIARVEDLDGPRIKPWAVDQAWADLAYLGLDWDATAPCQTERQDRYREVIAGLLERRLLYPCICSRKDVEAAASAPHASDWGPVYPGTCRNRFADYAAAQHALPDRPPALRLQLPAAPPVLRFVDQFAGPQTIDIGALTGDFVAAKTPSLPAYQLAVVIDDTDQGINHVVRGDDLLSSTGLQLHLQTVLGFPPPACGYCHLPLVVGPDGRRLAKRHGDTRLSQFRERGIPGERIVGFLAWRSGLLARMAAVTPGELLATLRTKMGLPATGSTVPPAGDPAQIASWLRSTIPATPLVLTPQEIAHALTP